MKTHLFILCLFLSNPSLADQILLAKGQTQKISAPRGTIFNSDSKVVKVHADSASLILIAKKEGEAQIVAGSKKYNVLVLPTKSIASFLAIQNLTKNMVGLASKIVGGKVIIYGDLLRFDDWRQLATKTQSEDLAYSFQAKLEEQLKDNFMKYIKQQLSSKLLPKPTLSFEPQATALISKEQLHSIELYKQILEPFGFKVLVNENSLSTEPTIGIKILVTEMRKKYFQRLGIKWPSSYQAQVLPTLTQNAAVMSIEALEESGMAKILASPHLICRSGKEAHFLAGGEIPIKIISQRMADVIWKKYGILLNVKPRADRSGNMSIQITTEVSTIDTSQTIDGIPGFLTNRIDSHFDLERSQTIVLSGLIKNEEGKSKEGLPFLSRLPILGSLFSSQEFRNQQTELVIMVTPKVLSYDE